MKSFKASLLCLVGLLILPAAGSADEEFYGRIESRPEGKAGNWIIGGRQVAVPETARLDEEDGPLVVGACAEVESKNGVVEEIETEDEASKCPK